jgi:hypothetical protein
MRELWDFQESNTEWNHMDFSFEEVVCSPRTLAALPGAQTVRRDGAGPVRALLGAKTSPAAVRFCNRSACFERHKPPEARHVFRRNFRGPQEQGVTDQ